MDKLTPILKQWFWILFGVVVILVFVGWFLGTGALAKKIDDRTSAIEALKPMDGKTTANDQWTAKLTKVRAERQQLLEVASDTLWEQQQAKYMVWPKPMRQYVEGKLFGAELSIPALNTYREIYDAQVYKLQDIVDAWSKNRQTGVPIPGKMIFNIPALEGIQTSRIRWPSGVPKSKAVWYLQEDLWLYTALLEAVAKLNMTAGADSTISQVPVRNIVSIVLKGGDPSLLAGAAGATTPGAAAGGGMYGSAPGGMPGGGPMMSGEMMAPGGAMDAEGGGGGYGGGMMGAGAGMPDVDFKLAEEIGPATPVIPAGTETATAGAAGGAGMYGGAAGAPPGGMLGGEMAGGMMTQGDPLLTLRRYVDKGAELPYKTRAFKMTVIMDHRKIPELLVELTDCAFPVTINRVNWAMANPDPIYDGNTKMPSETGGMMSGGMGYPGGAGGGEGFMGGGGMGGGFGDSSVRAGGAGGMGGMGAGGMGPAGGMYGGEAGYGGGYPGGSMVPGGGYPGGGGLGAGGGYPDAGAGYPGGAGMGGLGGAGLGGLGGGAGLGPMGAMLPGGAPGMNGMYGGGGPMGRSMVGPNLAMQGPTGLREIGPALDDPYMATVVIGGVMTIYRNPASIGQEIASAATAETVDAAVGAGSATGAAAPATGTPAAGTGTAAGTVPMGQTPDAVAPGAATTPAPAGTPANGTPNTPPAGTTDETAPGTNSGTPMPVPGGSTTGGSPNAPAAGTGADAAPTGEGSSAPTAAPATTSP